MKKYISFHFLVVLVVAACDELKYDSCVDVDTQLTTGFEFCDFEEIHLRVENKSQFDFENVTIAFYESADYGTIKAGQMSEYQLLAGGFSYGFVSVVVQDSVISLVPNDYVGEKPLNKGRYTYILDIVDAVSLTQELRKD